MQPKELPLWPTMEMREWQLTVFEDYMAKLPDQYLVVATPGAGKTTAALRIAHEMIRAGRVDRVVVVVPTRHIRWQWAVAAHRVGMDLDHEWEAHTGDEAPDFHGLVVTYAQFAYRDSRNMHRHLASKRRTLAIFDEVHHAGTSRAWGDGVAEAFINCPFKLALSGTPFRSDRNAIPFVSYQEGRSVADFAYGYSQALYDGVCRQVVFPSFGGRVEYMRGEDKVTTTFEDDTDEQGESDRLRAFLSPRGNWLRSEIVDAHHELMRMREDDPLAGGLVIAMDVEHARAIAPIIADVAGEEPVVAVSEDSDASKNIDRFAKGNQPWLVAVKMVSEGVDIPRLRVGVYATNTTSELFFRQAVGRFVRMRQDGPEEQSAAFYIPEDHRLIALALQIKEERDHVIPDEPSEALFTPDKQEPGRPQGIETRESEAQAGQTVFDAGSYQQERLRYAEELLRKVGQPTSHRRKVEAVDLLEAHMQAGGPIPTGTNSTPRSGPLKRDQKSTVARQQRGLLYRLACMQEITTKEAGRNVAEELGRRVGVNKPVYVDSSTPDAHRAIRGEILQEWLRVWKEKQRQKG